MSPPEGTNKVHQALNPQSPPQPGAPQGGAPQPTSTVRPVLPTSPFGNVPVTAAGGGVEFDHSAIRAFGGKLIQAVGKELTAARKHINAAPRKVEATSFTTFCIPLAHAYVQAVEYADVDLITKERVLTDYDAKLKKTADILREAEKKSTLKK